MEHTAPAVQEPPEGRYLETILGKMFKPGIGKLHSNRAPLLINAGACLPTTNFRIKASTKWLQFLLNKWYLGAVHSVSNLPITSTNCSCDKLVSPMKHFCCRHSAKCGLAPGAHWYTPVPSRGPPSNPNSAMSPGSVMLCSCTLLWQIGRPRVSAAVLPSQPCGIVLKSFCLSIVKLLKKYVRTYTRAVGFGDLSNVPFVVVYLFVRACLMYVCFCLCSFCTASCTETVATVVPPIVLVFLFFPCAFVFCGSNTWGVSVSWADAGAAAFAPARGRRVGIVVRRLAAVRESNIHGRLPRASRSDAADDRISSRKSTTTDLG